MRRILDSKFLFIIVLSLVVLLILGVGAFYLFDDSDAVFVKDGYVLNPLSQRSEKYFFDSNTSYKENLSAMVEFKDTDKIDVTILKDSFLHYLDDSMSFLKNGAIVDLDSIEGTKAVDFYNITNKSIIEKRKDGYVIESKNGDIELKNFMGRISDDKYIVVGNLEAQIPGNNTNIKADYFEIVYTDEGVINIENKDNKFQVTAEGTRIFAGDVVIDLGDKKITKGGNDVMSITAITINGNENIEIMPKAEEVTPAPTNPPVNNGGQIDNGNNANAGNNAGEGTGNEPTEQGNQGIGEDTNDIKIQLDEATMIGSTYVNFAYKIEGALPDDVFNLRVTNLDTGRTVDKIANPSPSGESINRLTPGTKYLFTLENERDGGKYYQKIIETKGFGIDFVKSYATDSSLNYTVTVSEDSEVLDADVSIRKLNENTGELDPVYVTRKDANGNDITVKLEYTLSDFFAEIKGKSLEIPFTGLESNTIYTAVLDNVMVGSGNNGEYYRRSLTDLTLKKTPTFSDLERNKGIDNNSFNLSLSGIEDPDNAIVSYTYYIYEKRNLDTPAISPIVRTDASPISVPFGNGPEMLKNDDDGSHKYVYRVVIKYFDNEKTLEYVTSDSVPFSMGSEPYITVVRSTVPGVISYNSIGGTIYLIDNSCTIPMPGREDCDGVSTARVMISYNSGYGMDNYGETGKTSFMLPEDKCKFQVTDNEIKCDFVLNNLSAATRYYIDVQAIVTDDNGDSVAEIIEHTPESKTYIDTDSLSTFTVDWDLNRSQMESSASHVIYTTPQLLPDANSGTYSSADTANAIQKIKVELYEGDNTNIAEYQLSEPIGVATFTSLDTNLADAFYNNRAVVQDSDFGIIYDDKTKTLTNREGREFTLQENYVIAIYAYYEGGKSIELHDNITTYKVSPTLFATDLDEPKIFVDPIMKNDSDVSSNLITTYLRNPSTVVGYHIQAKFDYAGLVERELTPTKMHVLVFDENAHPVKFYYESSGGLQLSGTDGMEIAVGESNVIPANIYMTYGTEYGNDDQIMRRGHTYYIGYYLDVTTTSGGSRYPSKATVRFNHGVGVYSESQTENKELPGVMLWESTSTANRMTYKYEITDPDAAIYKAANKEDYSFYYTVNDGEEVMVDITKVPGDYNTFSGNDLTLSNLTKGDNYKLYYKRNAVDTGDPSVDLKNEYVADSTEGRLFEGMYNIGQNDLKFEIINNPYEDNKVIIKLLGEDEVLSRVVNYHIKLTDTKGSEPYEENFINLIPCADDSKRCFTIDYALFKAMKSDTNHDNPIKVTLQAYYDNGLIGFDIPVGNEYDNKYMILQNHNINDTLGLYYTYSSRGVITPWSDGIGVVKGYYTYKFLDKDRDGNVDSFMYQSALKNSHDVDFRYVIDEDGYKASGVTVGDNTFVPKMVSMHNASSEGPDTFKFYSITPKIAINKLTRILNGAVVEMSLKGIADIEDFCDPTTCANVGGTPKYLYIETWASESDAINDRNFSQTVRKTVKVEIPSNVREPITAIIDGVMNDTNYWYRVYTYLNVNNQSVYTQLFHDNGASTGQNIRQNYTFKSLSSSEVFAGFDINYSLSTAEDAGYADKNLDTTINLTAYKNGVEFNFDLLYGLCKDLEECDIDNLDSIYFKRDIMNDSVKEQVGEQTGEKLRVLDSVDITNSNLEFNKNYRVNIYAIVDYYEDNNPNTEPVKRRVLLNRMANTDLLEELVTPSLTLSRNAIYDEVNDEYAIDFGVVANDPSRVLQNGKYFIKLLDKDGVSVGNLQVRDEETGNWTTIASGDEIPLKELDVTTINKQVRISGLPNPNTPYTVYVSGKAELNNYNPDTEPADRIVLIEKSYTIYTAEERFSIGFGDISYAPTNNSLVLSFIGGSDNINNVCSLDYTIGLWKNNTDENNPIDGGIDLEDAQTMHGTYVFPNAERKAFEYYSADDADNWRFVIDNDIHFIEGPRYKVKTVMSVCDTEGEVIRSFPFEFDKLTYAKSKP